MLLFLQVCCCLNGNIPQERGIVPLSFQTSWALQARAQLFGDTLETCFCNILFRVDAKAEDKL